MKIGDITIVLSPSKGENIPEVILHRRDKLWFVINENGHNRGLYPGEVRIANVIQESIIQKFHLYGD